MKFILIFITILLTSCSIQPKTLEEYYINIDYSCNQDSDCQIKNIGNCCGYSPSCINKNSNPNINIVNDLCKKESKLSICGFKEIESCKCINNKCKEQ